MKGVFVPLSAGIIVGLVLVGAFGARAVVIKRNEVKRGWNLKPVIVAAVDISDGTTLTFDHLSQRSVPEQFVSDSAVLPDQAAVLVGKVINVPTQAGDVLTWQHFAGRDKRVKECTAQLSPAVIAAGEAVADKAAEEFAAGLKPLPGGVVRPPTGEVVVLTADAPEGSVLTREMLKTSPYAAELITASVVPAERLTDLVGARAAVPMQKGDALLWQLLDSGKRPRSMSSCTGAVGKAAHAARERAAAQEMEKLK